MKVLTFYAVALDERGRLAQLRITREMTAPGVCTRQTKEWTGTFYRSEREATADLLLLNFRSASLKKKK